MYRYCHVFSVAWLYTEFGLVNRFIVHLQVVLQTITIPLFQYFTVHCYTLVFSVFANRFLATDLTQRSKRSFVSDWDFYAAGFDALVKRWNKCINVGAGYVEKGIFFPGSNYHVLRFIYICDLFTDSPSYITVIYKRGLSTNS
jgi:hypothetical protein